MIQTLQELAQGLAAIYPTAHYEFTSKKEPPFIVYLDEGEYYLHGDNVVVETSNTLTVELYTAKRDLEAENKLKLFFTQNEIPYEKGSTIKIDSEGLFLCPFTIEIEIIE